MNRHTFVAFKDYISGTGSVAVTSSLEHAAMLGMFDQIAFQVTTVEVSGTNPQLECQLWHSSVGGSLWLQKNPGNPEIPLKPIVSNAPNVSLGFDDGSVPSFRLVRFRIRLTAMGDINVHVTITATINDVRESLFAAKMRQTMLHAENLNRCAFSVQGGTPIDNNEVAGWGQELESLGDSKYLTPVDNFNPLHPKFKLADDAELCIMVDGSVVVNKHGHPPIELKPSKDGSSGAHGGC